MRWADSLLGRWAVQKKKEAAFEEPVMELDEGDAGALAASAQQLDEWKMAGRKGDLAVGNHGEEEEEAPEKRLLTVQRALSLRSPEQLLRQRPIEG